MAYTLDELATSTSLSKRTVYYYMSRGLLPQVGRGRGARYGEEHYWRLLLIRALTDLSVPLDLIQRHLNGLSLERVKLLVAPVVPLDDLQNQLREETQGIRKRLEPSTELDIGNMGLEDPMALRHRLSALEDQLARIEREEAKAREAVYRNLIAEEASEPQLQEQPATAGSELHGQLERLRAVLGNLERLCARLEQFMAEQSNGEHDRLRRRIADRSSQVVIPVVIHGENCRQEERLASPALNELADRVAETVARWETEQMRGVS